MSDLDHALAHTSQSIITIGIKTGSQLVVVLRDFLNYWYLISRDGSKKYQEVLKKSKGIFFRNEMELLASSRNTDVIREPVSKEERSMIARMCKKSGIDYCLAKRPPDLNRLTEAKYIQGKTLSPQQEKLLNAFICFDQAGKPLFETEMEGQRVPKLRDDQYLLTIAEKDLPKWDHICTALEVRGKRAIRDITRDIQAREAIEKGIVQNNRDKAGYLDINEPIRNLIFRIPKERVDVPDHSDRIVIQITQYDQVLIPVSFVKSKFDDIYEIEIPSNAPIQIKNGEKTTTKPIKDIQTYMVSVSQPIQVHQEKER